MNELRRLVSQNSSVEEIQAIGAALTEDFTQHQADLARLVKEVLHTTDSLQYTCTVYYITDW